MSSHDESRQSSSAPGHTDEISSVVSSGFNADVALDAAVVRWRCDPTEPHAKVLLSKLRKKWASWSPSGQWAFLNAVEAVAAAQRRKAPSRRRTEAGRYRIVRADAIQALKLADSMIMRFGIGQHGPALAELVAMNHAPGTDARDVVYGALGTTVPALASFALGCFYATGLPGKLATDPQAAAAMAFFKAKTGSSIPVQLLAEIASLAAGATVLPDTIRRLSSRRSLKASGFSRWKTEDALVERAVRHADEQLTAAWLTVVRSFLLTL